LLVAHGSLTRTIGLFPQQPVCREFRKASGS
jgi:hypothetical protein